MRRTTIATLLTAAALAGCGSNHVTPRVAPPPVAAAACDAAVPEGQGRMGVCTPRSTTELPGKGAHPLTAAPASLFVDVSSYQGRINWSSHDTPAVLKAGEGSSWTDPYFAGSWRQLARLHRWHAAYYFLRPGDCAGEGRRLVALIDAAGGLDAHAGPPVADAEVGLGSGCIRAFNSAVARADHWSEVVTYTSPGTYPGGGTGHLWVADYGSSHPCLWACPIAWQYSDGRYGPDPHCVAGLCGDVDRDLGGLLKITHAPACDRACQHRRDGAQLHADYRLRQRLRDLLTTHRCRTAHPAVRYRHACGVWLAEGQSVNAAIRALHAKGVN